MNCRIYTAALLLAAFTTSALAAEVSTNAVPPPKKSLWEGSVGLGLTVTSGNSETTLFNGNAQAIRKWGLNELNLGGDGNYGTDHHVKSVEQLRGYAQYNRLFTDRIFGYARGEALHDAIAAVDYRVTLSPGAGYYFIKETNTTLRAEVGPGWVYQQLSNTKITPTHPNITHDTDDYFTLRIADRFDQKLNDTVRLWQAAEYLPQVDKFENYIINAEAGIEVTLTRKLVQKTFIQDTYHSEPANGRKRNDLKLVAAVAYKF
jgi:putative salt-induced outer membrane protein YdiY